MIHQPKSYSCDVETGICDPIIQNDIEEIQIDQLQKVTLVYYTDPICSACWAIEPALKKFKLEYGKYVQIEYKMGGLLPGWEGFADKSNGISKPTDVASHWDDVGMHSGMSIDGDIWLEDPLSSSYPPSIAVKAMQNQGADLAYKFLRKIREMVFLEKKNITKEVHLLDAVQYCGGNTDQFLLDYNHEKTKQDFYTEVQAGRDMGVRGFPTFIFIGETGKGFKISGMSDYENYVLALEKAYGKALTPEKIKLNELELIQRYSYLATTEISYILSQENQTTTNNLNQLVAKGYIQKEEHKYGDFWRLIL